MRRKIAHSACTEWYTTVLLLVVASVELPYVFSWLNLINFITIETIERVSIFNITIMSFSIRTCPDGHSCENGSSCAQHPIKEGTYYCDCDTSPGDYAGLYCEYEAEIICQLQEETTSSWFCSNQGTCVLSTGATEAAWTCDCTDEFDGPVRFLISSSFSFHNANNLKE